ncbi:Usp domain-containing protein/Na_H_Exchanger domain-containing protein [Cephalotus follicularis]|uniref:Usp domain-containing protein/Na_H_Exchanger domain-containing protein n=1 Tax=Cephalotus follicularis TaxID=3775 RepID=A0A1Q3ASG0_CEPFO|nr:Usp domain-containing protein/Na_H_Exchanger domain-containing protein [Cephalotus follicularis]
MNTTVVPDLNKAFIVCMERDSIRSRGIFFGDSPFAFPVTGLYLQFSISALLTAFLQQILTPLGESAFVSQMLVGIAMGPSVVADESSFMGKVFSKKSYYMSETFAFFGSMLYMFLVGVRMDLSMIRRSGRKAVIIGLCSFFMPMTLNTIIGVILKNSVTMEPALKNDLLFVAAFQSINSFHVIVCLLADLKLLNSELGRLASCSSMISGFCAWFWIVLSFSGQQSLQSKNGSFGMMVLSVCCLLILLICILKPILMWMIKHTPDKIAISEGYVVTIFVMILGTSFVSEVIGQHFLFGPMILGIIVPDGPPLGSALVDKLETFISCIILPSYFVFSGSKMNFSAVHLKTVWIVEFLALWSFIGKVLGAMVPALFYNLAAVDAFSLGLIMSAQGITDALTLQNAMILKLVDQESYSIMVVSIVFLTGITTPIIKALYKPSKRYMSHRNRTIQHADTNAELRMMGCIYHQDNTHSIMDFLKISNPTPKRPICFYVIHLLELKGRSAPLLIHHRPDKKNAFQSNHDSDPIINAFRSYEKQHSNSVLVNLFSAISPYASMHDEICSVALEKRVCLVVVPFHKQWGSHGTEEFKPMRSVNQNILKMAPCSVGILVDRGTLGSKGYASKTSFRIGMIFVGGHDDREALAYAMRIGENPNVSLTVIRVAEPNQEGKYRDDNWELDDGTINEYKIAMVGKKNHVYKVELASDSVEMVSVIRSLSLEDNYDLILVGRHHGSTSRLFIGLTEWNEFPELGYIGDMLVSSDSDCKVSVLVVQQHTFANDDHSSIKSAIVDMPCDSVRGLSVS